MFDKYKERWAKLEEDHESVRKIKTHFEVNGKLYLVGAGCLTAGYLLRRPVKVVNESPAPVFNNHVKPVFNNIVISALGDPGNVVQNPITLETWPSQGALARSLGVAPSLVSAYFHGKIPDLKGEHYEIIGKAGHAFA